MLLAILRLAGHLDGIEHLRGHFPLANVAPAQRVDSIKLGIITTAVPFNVVMLIVIAVYLLDALYSDRRDRSILFWKSLPVSDIAVVLSKLATATLVAPLFTLAVVALTQLAVLLVASIFFLLTGVAGWGWLWNPFGWVYGWASLGYGYLLLSAVLLPYFAWLLLASSWARRTPFLWAAVPPLGLMILERWFLGSAHLAKLIFGNVHDLLHAAFNVSHGMNDMGGGHQVEIQSGLEFFFQPGLWGGLLVAALFVAGAIGLRRYRDES
jgi:ABC-2 type transport system permease protein